MGDDAELLRRFAEEGAQDAFAELVRRRVAFVYSAALRQVGGDTHLAEDVTQTVFLALAHEARRLKDRAVLGGWLYTTTRFQAAAAVRSHRRWRQREQLAHAVTTLNNDAPADAEWARLRPVLDEAMYELDERDREAILLRYFDGRAFAEIGARIGLAENTARMRVDRALEKLRDRLAKRGISSTATALGLVLTAQAVGQVPAGLAASVVGSALAGSAVGGGLVAGWSSVLDFMSTTKFAFVAMAIVAGLGLGIHRLASDRMSGRIADDERRQNIELAALRTENLRLRTDSRRLAGAMPGLFAPDPLNGDVPSKARMTSEILRSGMLGNVALFKGSGDLAAKLATFARAFGLDPMETESLLHSAEEARAEIMGLVKMLPPPVRTGDQVVFSVPELPMVRERFDRMLESFAATLGPERYKYFDELGGGSELAANFQPLGLVASELKVTRQASSPQRVAFMYRYEWLGTRDAPRRAGAGGRDALKVLGPVETIIPADF